MKEFTNETTTAELIDQNGQKERLHLTEEAAPEVAVRDAIADRDDIQRVVLRSKYDVEDVDEDRKDASGDALDVDEDSEE